MVRANLSGGGEAAGPLYNLTPPPGVPARLGFSLIGLNVFQYATLRSDAGYGLRVSAPDVPVLVSSVTETIWGTPADEGHDPERGDGLEGGPGGPSDAPKNAFFTLPTSCSSPPGLSLGVDSSSEPRRLRHPDRDPPGRRRQPARPERLRGGPLRAQDRLPDDLAPGV